MKYQKRRVSYLLHRDLCTYLTIAILLVFACVAHFLVSRFAAENEQPIINFKSPISSLDAFNEAYSFMTSEMGRDPDPNRLNVKPTNKKSLLEALCGRSGFTNASIRKLSFKEINAHAFGKRWPMALAFYQSKVPLLFIGKFAKEQNIYYQAICGKSQVMIFSQAFVEALDLDGFWCVSDGCLRSVPIQIGSTTVTIDKYKYNLGFLGHPGDSHVSLGVSLTNQGPGVISLQNPVTSCGCTVASLSKSSHISPGDSTQISLELETQGSSSLRVTTWLDVREDGSTNSRRVPIEVLATRWPEASLLPNRVEFGRLRRNSNATRSILLKGTPFELIRSLRVTPAGFPGQINVNDLGSQDGVEVFRISFSLAANALGIGEHQFTVHVQSLGDHSRQFEIPVNAVIVPPVEIRPSIVVMRPSTAASSEQSAFLEATEELAFKTEILSMPPNWQVRLRVKSPRLTEVVISAPSEPVFEHEIVRLKIHTSSSEDYELSIPCVRVPG